MSDNKAAVWFFSIIFGVPFILLGMGIVSKNLGGTCDLVGIEKRLDQLEHRLPAKPTSHLKQDKAHPDIQGRVV